MLIILLFLSLLALFYLLGKTTEVAVFSINKISSTFKLPIFFVGILLGLFTSLPELMIGINALVDDISEVSFGNLLGGSLVLFGLIFGLGLMLERKVLTDGKIIHIIPILGYLFLPFLFGFDGSIKGVESIILILLYPLMLFLLFKQHKNEIGPDVRVTVHKKTFIKNCFWLILVLIGVALISHTIIIITAYLLKWFHVQGFVVGLLLFAIGTNLPELSVMIASWKTKTSELSLSHLIGSVIVDPLLIGIFSLIRPYESNAGFFMANTMMFSLLLFAAVAYFYRTGKRFTREEGFILFTIYLAFAITNVGISLKS